MFTKAKQVIRSAAAMNLPKRRLISHHVIDREEEGIVATHIEHNKRLVVVHGPEACGRTVFLNRVYNNLITRYGDGKVVFCSGSSMEGRSEDVVGMMNDLILPQPTQEYGVDSLIKEISEQTEKYSHFVIILDLHHSSRSIRDSILFLNTILSAEKQCFTNVSIVVSFNNSETRHLLEIEQNHPSVAVSLDIGLLSTNESRRLLKNINPRLNAAIEIQIAEARAWVPAELCIIGGMTKQCDTSGFISNVTATENVATALPDKEDFVEIMKTLSKDERELLCQLLGFPSHFSIEMMLKFTHFSDVQLLHSLSEHGYWLLAYDPAVQLFHFQANIKRKLLDVISCQQYFEGEDLYTSHYWNTFERISFLHLELLVILGQQFLHRPVHVPAHVVHVFFLPEVHQSSELSVSEKAMKHMTLHRTNIVNSIEEMLECMVETVTNETLPTMSALTGHLLKVERLLDLSTCYIMQKMVMFQRVTRIYDMVLNIFKRLPNHAVSLAKTNVARSFFYLHHISFEAPSQETEDTLKDAIDVLKDAREHEALGTAYFKLGRLLYARRCVENPSLRTQGMAMYQRGYQEWENLTDNTMTVLVAVAHRHNAALHFNEGDFVMARKVVDDDVFPVYEEMGMTEHPFYGTACCFYARVLMNITEENEDRPTDVRCLVRRRTLSGGRVHPATEQVDPSAPAIGLSQRRDPPVFATNLNEAKDYLDQSLLIRAQTLGDFHHDTIISMKGIGKYYQQSGDWDENAVEFLRMAAQRALYVLGNTEQTALMFRLYGERLHVLGREDEAMETSQKARDILEIFENSRNGTDGVVFPIACYSTDTSCWAHCTSAFSANLPRSTLHSTKHN